MAKFTVSWAMGFVLMVALGIAAMRSGSTIASGFVLILMLGGLLVGTLGAMVRPRPSGPWRGFALFGWSYFALTFLRPDLGWEARSPMPSAALITGYSEEFHPIPERPDELLKARHPSLRLDNEGEPIVPVGAGRPPERDIEEARAFYELRESYNDAFRGRDRRIENSRTIGHASMTLALALIGALVGRALEPRGLPGRLDH